LSHAPAVEDDNGVSPAVLTLVKALDVLEAVAATSGMTVAEIAAKVGLNRSTTHRLVQTLRSMHYLQPAPNGRGLEVGLKLLPLAARQLDSNRVRLAALPHLSTLAQDAGERVNLGVLFDGELLYLAGVEKPSLPNMYSRFGKLAPIHCSSLGKAIIAQYPEAEIRAMFGSKPLLRQTDNTIVDVDLLLRDLAESRARGYAFDDQEHLPNVFCIAAPIFDGDSLPCASVGISGSDRDRVLSMVGKVKLAAEVITHVLTPSRPG
jgi:DNA-binding IclR family transcriptional regulator